MKQKSGGQHTKKNKPFPSHFCPTAERYKTVINQLQARQYSKNVMCGVVGRDVMAVEVREQRRNPHCRSSASSHV